MAATICPRPTLTFDLEVGVGVACDLGYPCAKFRLPRPFGCRVRADVRDIRRTTDADDRLMPPPPYGAGAYPFEILYHREIIMGARCGQKLRQLSKTTAFQCIAVHLWYDVLFSIILSSLFLCYLLQVGYVFVLGWLVGWFVCQHTYTEKGYR